MTGYLLRDWSLPKYHVSLNEVAWFNAATRVTLSQELLWSWKEGKSPSIRHHFSSLVGTRAGSGQPSEQRKQNQKSELGQTLAEGLCPVSLALRAVAVLGLPTFWGKNTEIYWDCSRTLRLGKICHSHFHGLQLMRCCGAKHWKWQYCLGQTKCSFPKMVVSRSRGRKICNIKHWICWSF